MSVGFEVSIQSEDFDVSSLQSQLAAGNGDCGAIAGFTGVVRAASPEGSLQSMVLEHYPGMTERSIRAIVDEACERWSLLGARVVHRIGELRPGEQIVYVGVSSKHRGEAFEACEFIMDYLKTRAPFWKKEQGPEGAQWVDARESDTAAAERWANPPNG